MDIPSLVGITSQEEFDRVVCKKCGGIGKFYSSKCRFCRGHGVDLKETFLQLTLEKLGRFGKTPDDILYISSGGLWFSWEQFTVLANFPYYSTIQEMEVEYDLMIVGFDFFLDRNDDDYDCGDSVSGWKYNFIPNKPVVHGEPKSILKIRNS